MNMKERKKLLEERQKLSLEEKIELTKERIKEWYEAFDGKIYVSFSGGKDSTVLLHIVRSMYPEVEAVFCNTGLEYPEIVRFVRKFDNVTFVYPTKRFKQVIEEYGYPVVSKKIAGGVGDVQNTSHDNINTVNLRLFGYDKNGNYKPHWKISKKWRYLTEAPFKISSRCCYFLKKAPMAKFTKKSGKVSMNGMLMDEGGIRVQSYLKSGCNAFDAKEPKSSPMAFWLLQDVLEYIDINKLGIAKCYGDLIKEDGEYKLTKLDRTGCVFCMFGIHFDGTPNRFQKLKESHPKLWDYAINKLNCKQCLEFMGVEYE